ALMRGRMTKTGSPRLYKSVFVASFRPNLRYFSLFRTAAERVSGFANWSTDDSSVSLRDYQARCSLAIRHNEFAFSQDSADLRNEEQRIHSALEVLPAALEVNTFSRLGFRRQY